MAIRLRKLHDQVMVITGATSGIGLTTAQMISAGSKAMPGLFDRYMNATMFKQQKSSRPSAPNRRDALYKPDPSSELRQRQGMPQKVHERSIYTKTSLRSSPLMTAAVGAGALFAAFTLSRRYSK